MNSLSLEDFIASPNFFGLLDKLNEGNQDDMEQVQILEEMICNDMHRGKEIMQQLLSICERNQDIISFVPSTIVEKLCQLVSLPDEELLELAILLLGRLCVDGNHREIFKWTDLNKHLSLISHNSTIKPDLLKTVADFQGTLLASNLSASRHIHIWNIIYDKKLKQLVHEPSERGWEDIEIKQKSYLEVGLAWKVWDAGLLLAQWVHTYSSLFEKKTVLELGSGCGYVGVVLAKHHNFKKLILTDRINSSLQNIQSNLETNIPDISHMENILVRHLDWTYPQQEVDSIDVIIASDIIYDFTAAENVPRAIEKLLSKGGIAIVVLPSHREGVKLFEQNMKTQGFEFSVSIVKSQREDGDLNFYVFHKTNPFSELNFI